MTPLILLAPELAGPDWASLDQTGREGILRGNFEISDEKVKSGVDRGGLLS
jgi:hypothetical protein